MLQEWIGGGQIPEFALGTKTSWKRPVPLGGWGFVFLLIPKWFPVILGVGEDIVSSTVT